MTRFFDGFDIFVLFVSDTVRKEAATIMVVFPSPNDVMAILVQARRKECLVNFEFMINFDFILFDLRLQYLRMLAVAYEKTQ